MTWADVGWRCRAPFVPVISHPSALFHSSCFVFLSPFFWQHPKMKWNRSIQSRPKPERFIYCIREEYYWNCWKSSAGLMWCWESSVFMLLSALIYCYLPGFKGVLVAADVIKKWKMNTKWYFLSRTVIHISPLSLKANIYQMNVSCERSYEGMTVEWIMHVSFSRVENREQNRFMWRGRLFNRFYQQWWGLSGRRHSVLMTHEV